MILLGSKLKIIQMWKIIHIYGWSARATKLTKQIFTSDNFPPIEIWIHARKRRQLFQLHELFWFKELFSLHFLLWRMV
jgi:hypothetical protein